MCVILEGALPPTTKDRAGRGGEARVALCLRLGPSPGILNLAGEAEINKCGFRHFLKV